MYQAHGNRKPDYRGVFHDGVFSLVRYLDWMPQPFGFARPMLHPHNAAVIADLEIIRGGGLELIVTEITCGSGKAFREAMIAFAEQLGYERVWFDDEVVDLDPFAGLGLAASTTCSACGTTFREDQPEFLLTARRHGVWPVTCPLDGQPLPQWSLSRTGEGTSPAEHKRASKA